MNQKGNKIDPLKRRFKSNENKENNTRPQEHIEQP
jgi:hypothetical protein